MRQVSPESPGIYDFIIGLYRACDGDWKSLIGRADITAEDLASFLEYAGMILSNLGNYYGEGDRKFVPDLRKDVLRDIAAISEKTREGLEKIIAPMLAVPPFTLGHPSGFAQSGYYLGDESITPGDITRVSEVMNKGSIGPENTRARKVLRDGNTVLEVLQASAETDLSTDQSKQLAEGIILIRGDHSAELTRICEALEMAKQCACNDTQTDFLTRYIESFRTGSLEAFQASQKAWVKDISARVENIMGFIESYRDPAGIRAEWEAMVGIADADEIRVLKRFADSSTTFIRKLPWAVNGVNDGKGPFEKTLFETPDFSSVHALAVCGSVVFEAANLPNYEYIRETCGFKNIVLANRLSINNNPNLPCYWIKSSQVAFFRKTTHIVRYLTTVIHELLGHGTGKILSETGPGIYNFDKESPPINPLTGEAITSYYRIGQTWGSVFGKLAGTVEECRAILMSEYLMDDKELLGIFGYNDSSDITADDLLYATYLNIGVDGLQALEHYNAQTQTWGQVHHQVWSIPTQHPLASFPSPYPKRGQAHFAILNHILQISPDCLTVAYSRTARTLTVRLDRSRIRSHGKPALGQFLTKLHIWRCTADVDACKNFYESMCEVDDVYEEWREVVVGKPKMRWKFVQPNTFVQGEGEDLNVAVKVYDETNEGIIQSWVERDV
ncbi:peptidase M49, dipeptidyl-peptidase III [Lophiostoma macrostomum CBS 122681]|uniref:Peptidase M49, dipeptidyl-peptidase III n=1 Tax=Lophiostoma macrostomum CBS 122681 TaxID=1314788 RepID=A0A6A6THZ5_9PLEO|nr:peptidase M49, dipeptidyl-peptidase III [Lophiostoma macrostomum CBS 122681]